MNGLLYSADVRLRQADKWPAELGLIYCYATQARREFLLALDELFTNAQRALYHSHAKPCTDQLGSLSIWPSPKQASQPGGTQQSALPASADMQFDLVHLTVPCRNCRTLDIVLGHCRQHWPPQLRSPPQRHSQPRPQVLQCLITGSRGVIPAGVGRLGQPA